MAREAKHDEQIVVQLASENQTAASKGPFPSNGRSREGISTGIPSSHLILVSYFLGKYSLADNNDSSVKT